MNEFAAPGGVVLVTFALPDESRDFTAALAGRVVTGRHLPVVSGTLDGRRVVVVHTGVGDESGGRQRLQAGWQAARALAEGQPPRWVVSAGYAGGLGPDLRVGDLVVGANHSEPALAARARRILDDAPRVGLLHTQKTVAETAAEKRALHAATGALAVDMETAWIAAACAAAGVPLLSLRVVSDAAGFSFPVPGRILFDAVRQRPRYLALPLWLAAHPSHVAPFVRFVRGLPPARARLTRSLCRLVAAL